MRDARTMLGIIIGLLLTVGGPIFKTPLPALLSFWLGIAVLASVVVIVIASFFGGHGRSDGQKPSNRSGGPGPGR